MNHDRWNLTIQLATLAAVVAGMTLVIWELQQTRELVRAQLSADAIAQINAQDIALMGEAPATALAKACDEPDALSTENMIVLSHYYGGVVNRLRRLLLIERRSDTYVAGDRWQEFAEGNFMLIFATEFGRWWWKNSSPAEKPILEEGNRFLAELGPPLCSGFSRAIGPWSDDRLWPILLGGDASEKGR